MAFGDELLTHPDLFPARCAGEPWGDREIALEIAGAAFRFVGLSATQAGLAERRFGDATAFSGGGGKVETRVFRASGEDFRPVPVGREYRLELDPGPSAVRLAGLGFMGLLEARATPDAWAGALFTDTEDPDRFPDVLENYLRPLAALRALESRILLVHSAAIADDDGAWLFPGRSGAGKSTLAALAERAGWRVVSDELNAVGVDAAGDARLGQVPFVGDRGRARRLDRPLPLRGVVRLRHAADGAERMAPVGPGEALALLYAAVPYLNLDPYRGPRAEALLAGLAARVPAFELSFRLGSDLAVFAGAAAA